MFSSISSEVWVAIVSAIVGVTFTVLGQFVVDKVKERQKKNDELQQIECVELINQAKMIDNDIFGPMAKHIQIKVPESGPKSKLVEMRDLYLAKYCLRNLSDTPISNILIKLENAPKAVWFTISEGDGNVNPDWEAELKKKLKEKIIPNERGWDVYPIPYINPYSTTQHQVYLEVASFLPLSNVHVTGGAKGVKFTFQKHKNLKNKGTIAINQIGLI